MTREDVIRWAREAELPRVVIGGYDDELVRFAAIVAAHEREEAQRALDHQAWGFRWFLLAQHERYKDRCNYFAVALEEFKRAEEVAKVANDVRQKENPPA